MKRIFYLLLILLVPILSSSEEYIIEDGKTIETRFITPKGYKRIKVKEGSFKDYLRKLPLKPYNTKVKYYDGRIKESNLYVSVVDIDIGNKNLLQCADAIIKLRCEYLYKINAFDKISFHLTNDLLVPFNKWSEGYRIKVQNNITTWFQTDKKGTNRKIFNEYLEFIFTYSGTLSLEKDLYMIEENKLNIGDVIINGGCLGHAAIIVDVAKNIKTKEKIFLLAQSYMPAQEIHILKSFEKFNPWYILIKGKELKTPEWIFKSNSLRRFK